jgi:hypothetical protein
MELGFKLHSNQGKVFQDEHRYRVVVAGRRFGKTYLALTSLLIEALQNQKAYLWYVAPTFRQAKMIAWRLIKDLVEGTGVAANWNEAELWVEFPHNGSRIELKGADNEDSLRGAGLGSSNGRLGLVVDEFATIHDNWSVWHEVLRPALADKQAGVIFIGTPKGKDSFYELWLRGEREEEGWASWQFKTTDNLALDLEGEVAEAKLETPERYFKQEYEASFQDFVGLVYPEFSYMHICEPHYLPDEYPRFGAIDPAMSGTTAVLMAAIDEDGRFIIYDEFYEKDKRASEVADSIKDGRVRWFIDPASKMKNNRIDGSLYSLYDEYAQYGISARPAENDVMAGINRVGEFFKREDIKIFSSCEKLIWELERYHWAENKESTRGIVDPKPFKKNDHLCDCLRYLVMSRSPKANLDRPMKVMKGSVAYEMAKMEIESENWRSKYNG